MKNNLCTNRLNLKHILLLFALLVMISSCSKKKETPEQTPDTQVEDTKERFDSSKDRVEIIHEFRGAWIATVMGLDWPNSSDKSTTQQSKLRTMIQQIKQSGCNAVIFQVCCNSDAMWASEILPWSSDLTGTEGKYPGYDPLQIVVTEGHNQGLEVHAWINPLRCSGVSKAHDALHPYNRMPQFAQQYGSSYYWDPGNPEIADYLASIATELMTKYDLDGLHIDDFFYPDGLKDDAKTWDDSALYEQYGNGKTLTQWRESNINRIVKTLHTTVHNIKPNAIFGVSPAGRMELTTYLYADPEQWVAEGSVDYLAPQIYWPHNHSFAGFKKVLESWRSVAFVSGVDKAVPMIPGLAPYRLGESGFETMQEFMDQVTDTRNSSTYTRGNIWFRAQHITASNFLQYMKSNIYPSESLIPELGAGVMSKVSTISAPKVSVDGYQIKWEAVDGATEYAVYELNRKSAGSRVWSGSLQSKSSSLTYRGRKDKNYTVIALREKEKSQPSNVVFVE